MNENAHIPVLAEEVLEYVLPSEKSKPFRAVDGTVGYGGHGSLILRGDATAELLGIDHDVEALRHAEDALSFAGDRVRLIQGAFSSIEERVISSGWHLVDAVLLDIGVSSPQIDTPVRGFSFRSEGPLDMRMDKSSGKTAARVLNNYSEEGLALMFKRYGELKGSGKLARAIVERRKNRPWSGTLELAELCEQTLGGATRKRSVPPATLCFQALRIEVNDELEELKKALEGAVRILNRGGRLVVITFHSLEDRIVKQFFREKAAECLCPPGLPACVCGQIPSLRILTRKPITASEDELKTNRRAASAKLRAAERI
ncbi:MAG: 16S rRNA (cytosine(1402)-N(4))-methyltransferase RsmH [Victivallales bacterium]|nr:16S rRNA (cytosine(1402)-N(4))-methyltransferase RsmH [Victivallales bacterium]